jgi:ABC-type cobalamin/Fe3+-siderophores transport system ATPase subunit
MMDGQSIPSSPCEQCSFGYTGTPVLEDIDFRLGQGRFYGLLGPNGSGKTSLLDLMSGAAAPQRGQDRFQGREIRSYGKHALARRMAIVPQDLTISVSTTRSSMWF